MHFKLFGSLILAGGMLAVSPVMAQSGYQNIGQMVSTSTNGGFSINLRGQQVTLQKLETALPGMLGLSNKITLKEASRKTDNLGYIHICYDEYFNGVMVQDGMILVHLKDGFVTSVNGTAYKVPENFALPTGTMSSDQAVVKAMNAMGVVKLIRQYPVALVITQNPNLENRPFTVGWKVRIDGWNKEHRISMNQVYLDAQTGILLNSYPLIHDADVNGNAQTLYAGNRAITVDSMAPGQYRLWDNTRNIRTFNAGGVLPNDTTSSPNPFVVDVDYFNNSSNWGQIAALSSFSVNSLGNSGFLSQGQFLIDAIGHGTHSADLNNGSFLSTNLLYPTPTTTPISEQGLYLQVNDDSLWGLLAPINVNFQSGALTVLDSLFFDMSDTTIGTHSWSDGNGNAGNYTIELKKNPALDAHWGMEETHSFYTNAFSRNSYDDQGSVVRNYIDGMMAYSGTQNNAAALPAPYNAMVYGMGDGVLMGPVVALDVMGHEFSHMVTDNNGHGGLNYQGESGALNESFSDMMGTAIEFFADTTLADWTIGEDVSLVAPFYFRDMANPKGNGIGSDLFTPQPDTYLGQFWYTGNQDNGGVHINSGVPNKWFYLVSQGGTGVNDNAYNYQVTGQGIDKARQIAYRTQMSYITPGETILDYYQATLQATADLYGATSSTYETVKDAWLAVGVPNNNTAGIDQINPAQNFIKIYPNPAKTQVTLASNWDKDFDLNFYDVTGRVVKTLKVHSGQQVIEVGDLSRGTYFLKFNLDQKDYSQKLTLF